MGTIAELGGGTGPVAEQDGPFEHRVHSGIYCLSVWEVHARATSPHQAATEQITVTDAILQA
jgi:hypothetical protein